jgi:hypothetical protein
VAALPSSQPQVRVSVDGVAVLGVLAVDIEQVAYFAADRFVALFALDRSLNGGAVFFGALSAQSVVIELAVEPFGYVSLFTGQIDNVRMDLRAGTAALTGRDLSASLIDTEISQTFANQTASDIATAIAGGHGLTPNVTATRTLIGQYYELDHAKHGLGLNSRTGTAWNLLSWLAMIEGFSLSVTGTVLNFMPSVLPAPFYLTPQDCIDLSIDIATTIPVSATVKSWNTRNKAAFTQTAGTGTGPSATLIRPNLTSAQANLVARNHLADLAWHKTIMIATMPGELALAPSAPVSLSQTNSPLDQTYLVDSIRRCVDTRRGFVQTVRAHAAD